MKELAGKTAVVTGAASGIGKALAEAFASEEMKVVLADVEEEALEVVAETLRESGAETIAVVTDVAVAESVEALAARGRETFGNLHVVCNNAGVFAGGLCWQEPLADYEWVLGVNVWGVIHGIRTFVPTLIEHGEEAHVVNTASMAAVTAAPFSAVYTMSKHAVLALSECLYQELQATHPQIGVSCLCPEAIRTGIGNSSRNRPASLGKGAAGKEEAEMVEGALRETVERGLPPQAMAERVVSGIRNGSFYLVSDDDWMRAAEQRMEAISSGRNPGFLIS